MTENPGSLKADPQLVQPNDDLLPPPNELGVGNVAGEASKIVETLPSDNHIGLASNELLPSQEINPSKLRKAMHVAKRAVESTVIAVEVGPTNGIITYGSAAATLIATKDPLLSAAVLGGSTAALEGAAAVATADVLSSEKQNKAVNLISKVLNNRFTSRFVLTEDGKLLPVAEGLLAVYGGTALVMTAKEGEEAAKARTHTERLKYGLKTAAVLGALCTAQGVLYSEGILNYKNPEIIAPVVGATVGFQVAANKLRGRLGRKKEAEEAQPRYDLSQEELQGLETELVKKVESRTKSGLLRRRQPSVYATWLASDSKYANILRTNEANYFPEVKELSGAVEDDTTFLAMVDTRKESRRVVHGTTISGLNKDAAKPEAEGKSGFTTIDELIEMGNFSVQEFNDYYAQQGIDLAQSISVDTNFRIGESAEPVDGLKTADLAYLTLFQLLERRASEGTMPAVFASINSDSIRSFQRIGLKVEPLMGRDNLITPESRQGQDFHPVAIPLNEEARALFKGMSYSVPEVTLT